MADIKVSALNEATQSEITDSTLALAAVVDGNSSTGYASRKSAFSKIASYILNTFSGLSLGGVTRTVKTAIDAIQTSVTSLVSKMGSTSISSIGDGTVTGAISALNIDLANKGVRYIDVLSSAKSAASGTVTNIAKLTLPAGTYLLIGMLNFVGGSGSYRVAYLASSATGSNYAATELPPVSGANTRMQVIHCLTFSADATVYLNALQNSGTALNVNGQSSFLCAVRLA